MELPCHGAGDGRPKLALPFLRSDRNYSSSTMEKRKLQACLTIMQRQ